MSDNNWETQPRKDNGEFTFRYEFWKKKLEAMEAANANKVQLVRNDIERDKNNSLTQISFLLHKKWILQIC